MSKNDVFINGTGSSGGGIFGNAGINGTGKFTSSVECGEFNCNGTGRVYGDLTADEIEIKGTFNISGDVSAKEIDVSGAVKISGNAKIKEIDTKGAIAVAKDLSATDINVDGECKVSGSIDATRLNLTGILKAENCECEKFTVSGKIRIKGLLTAEDIDLKLHWNSTIKEVGGHKVIVELADNFVHKLLAKFVKPKLKVDVIEADEIKITYTKATIVRGANVTLGDGCEVDLVEYTESFTPGSNARFKKAVKV